MKWSSSSSSSSSDSKKFQVKVKPLKLQGLIGCCDQKLEEKEKTEKVIVLEMKWRGPKAGLVPLRQHSSNRRYVSKPVVVKQGEVFQWDDIFESVCNLSMKENSNSFNSWDMSFNLLHGRCTEPTKKLAVIGSVSLNIAELALLMEPLIERELPISVRVAGVSSEAMLLVSVSFAKIRNSQDSVGVVNDAGILRMVKDLRSYMSISKNKKKKKKKKKKKTTTQSSADEGEMSDDSYSGSGGGGDGDDPGSDSEESPNTDSKESLGQGCVAAAETKDESSVYYVNGSDKETSSETQMESSPSPKTGFGSISKVGFLSWKKRRPSFVFSKSKGQEKKSEENADQDTNETLGFGFDEEEVSVGRWEEKEVISRDGRAKIKANVFFASMDQRSEKAAGESACTALVTVIADWLHSNRDAMPSRFEFDNLIKEGSSEWRKLCDNEVYLQRFPDKHFDLETMLEAKLRPLSMKPEKSFVGFFCPENFESLKGTMCFEGIWDEISRNSSNVKEAEPKVYIVSWNDHFFILKVEADAYYIIDTLGERLFEGCNKAYILKFDDRSCLYRLPENSTKEGTKDKGGGEEGGESESLVCSGKECCREFIKRFFAAIPLRELEKEEEKGTASIVSLHQRLQIEFHFSSISTSSSSSSSSFPSSSSSCHSPSSSSVSLSSSFDEYENTRVH
ncbi:uncharacterized protein LOC122650952 [Telopea speciosissima]|uniref:uncharacterized protein LOC122650952 n=1 Tax=Telopea speciosissima TaxID=54955 RepID=UPI001CC4983F|nr:uncharacterized protein LOC122650952 [Telopea speciosissima]